MPFVKKYAKKVKKTIRRRYTQKKGGQVKLGQIARDVMFLKSQINAEHKHIDTVIGSTGSAAFVSQLPTRTTPIILALDTPDRGTANYNRIGNQVIVTHITAKYQFTFGNTIDKKARTTVRARIIWAKSAADVPVIADILESDANDNYTPMSFINEQEYNKYIWLKALDCKKSHYENTPYNPTTLQSTAASSATFEAQYYPYRKWNGRIKMEYNTGTDTVSVNKPYLVLTSDVKEDTNNWDPVSVTGTIRLTYIDN